MAWEERRGRRYYYRKRRQGGHVVSEYIGGGAFGVVLAGDDAAERQGQCRAQAMRRRAEESDAALDEVTEMATMLTTAALLVGGCRTHKGQWRQRREQHDIQ